MAALAVVYALTLVAREGGRRRRFARARERGAAGELRAGALLEGLGFTILGRQVGGGYELDVDGAPHTVGLRADYIVRWGGRRFVAEVKTGSLAPRLETSATRRQLLEYRIAFDVDGVLLVDAERGQVRSVEFPFPARFSSRARAGYLFAGIALGGFLGASLASLAFLAHAR